MEAAQWASLSNSLLGTLAALVLGYFIVRQLIAFPGVEASVYIFPAFAVSYSLLIFTCIAMGLVTVLLWKSGKFSASSLLRIFGIITIIGVSSLLLIAGYSKEQLTPIVGLFGAIAGYLLGKEPSAEH